MSRYNRLLSLLGSYFTPLKRPFFYIKFSSKTMGTHAGMTAARGVGVAFLHRITRVCVKTPHISYKNYGRACSFSLCVLCVPCVHNPKPYPHRSLHVPQTCQPCGFAGFQSVQKRMLLRTVLSLLQIYVMFYGVCVVSGFLHSCL